MSAALISVVIPTRDRIATLALCLDRLAPGAQSLPHDRYEVIVSDDSASESARELIRERFPWVRWSAGPKRGPASNRNAGARAARGEWLAFTDDDCLPEPGWLAAFAAVIDAAPEKLVLEGRTTCRAGIDSPRQTAPINLTGGLLWSCNFAMRRSEFEQIGGFDERYRFAHMEDADLQARIVRAGFTTRFVPTAEIDHPPRTLAWGATLARIHEASVLHMVLHGPMRGLPWYLMNQSRARLSRIVRDRKSLDTLTSLASLPVELGTIVLHWHAWLDKARDASRRSA